MQQIRNLIGGKFVEPHAQLWLDDFNPATHEVHARVPDSTDDDVSAAVDAANAAFPAWSRMATAERARLMNRLADWIEANFERLVRAETDDNGKTLRQSRSVDIPRCSTNLRFFAALGQTWASESHHSAEHVQYTLRQPLGVVACISPWNLPLYLFTWKIAPALAAGNCVIGKPSEITPLTAYLLSQGVIECGWPPGVLNIVHGTGAVTGEALVNNPGIRALSFTGGTKTGAHIAARLAPRFVKASFELGGKNPNLIFADCHYERMLETTLRSSFANQGQICLCGSRILVQDQIYDRFRDDLVRRAKGLVVGDPLDDASDLGAVVSRPHMEKILGCIDAAQREGGTILCGGDAVRPIGRCANGCFVAPTVIEGLGPACQTNQEEIFGPVVTLQPFGDEAEAIDLANATQYGLSASVWTQDSGAALRCAEQLAAGVVWVNSWLVRDLRTPFGGVRNSGSGREGGLEAMRFFTETKNVCLALQ
jgi:aminomuconate-semialdehyde/2-hydroxymuconate-6-semialdehyde dehydrogenase